MDRRIVAALCMTALVTGGTLVARSRRRKFPTGNASAAVPYDRGRRIERHATIARDPTDVYAAWRNFEHLPHIMPNLRRVETLDATHSRWTIVGPGNTSLAWVAELIDASPNERIAWRVDAAAVPHAGSVRFSPAPGGRGTEVAVEIEYLAPAGLFGRLVALVVQAPPVRLGEIDLRRFKSILEVGDVALNGTDIKA